MPKLQTLPLFVGIDPGQSGGISSLESNGPRVVVHQCESMPGTERDVWNLISGLPSNTIALIERVHSMPKQGVASSFTFGKGFGGLRMALTAAGVPFEDITPQAWQKALGVVKRGKEEPKPEFKKRLRALAQQLYPDVTVTLDTADSLLIATYLLRKYTGRL